MIVPLLTPKLITSSQVLMVHHMFVGMPVTKEVHIYSNCLNNSVLGDCKTELLFLPIWFQFARILNNPLPQERPLWSQDHAYLILGIDTTNFFPMKAFCWNCWGAASSETNNKLKDMVNTHDPLMVILLETRFSTAGMDAMRRHLNFDLAYGINAMGFSSGIWLMWDSQRISFDILPHDFQAIHAIIHVLSVPKFRDFKCLFSAVYASPDLETRTRLWEELIVDIYKGPWALLGDFNDIIYHNEKSGGRRPNSRRVEAYRDMAEFCELIDLPFKGSIFYLG